MSVHPSTRLSVARSAQFAPLRTLLILPILAPLLITACLTIWWSHRQGSRAVQTQAGQLHQEVANRVDEHLNHFFSQPVFALQLTAQAIQNEQLTSQDLDSLKYHFWGQSQVFPQLSEIYWGSRHGDLIGVMRYEDGQQALVTSQLKPGTRSIIALDAQGRPGQLNQQYDYDPRQRPWYQLAQTTGDMQWSEVYRWSRGPILGITLTQPEVDKQGTLQGVFAIDLNLGSIQQFLRQLSIAQAGQVLIVDRAGFLIASSTEQSSFRVIENEIQRLTPLDSENSTLQGVATQIHQNFGGFARISQEQTLQYQVDGATQLVHLMPWSDDRGLDWVVMVVVPRAEIIGPIHRNTQITTALNFVVFAIATTLSLIIAHWLTNHSRAQADRIQSQESFLRALYEGVEAAIFTIDVEDVGSVESENQTQPSGGAGLEHSEPSPSTHKQFRCIDVSPAHSRMSRLSREQILNKTPEEYLEPQAAETVIQEYWTCLKTRDRVSYENRLEHEGHVSWWLTTICPVKNEADQIHRLVVTGLNITQRKEAELRLAQRTQELAGTVQTLKQTQAKLIESAKMAALGKLVAGVAHEINTPIGTSILAASTLKHETQHLQTSVTASKTTTPKSNESSEDALLELDEYLDLAVESSQIIVDNLNRAGDLIQTFKQAAIEQTRFQPRLLNLKSYIQESVQSLIPQLKPAALHLEIKGDDDLMIESDPGTISQIMTNLVMNSLIHAHPLEEGGMLKITVESKEDFVELRYQDDGLIIAPERLTQIFDPFFTTSSLAHSSGLGMHLVYSLVTRQLQGSITVENLINRGAEFTIQFPTITPLESE